MMNAGAWGHRKESFDIYLEDQEDRNRVQYPGRYKAWTNGPASFLCFESTHNFKQKFPHCGCHGGALLPFLFQRAPGHRGILCWQLPAIVTSGFTSAFQTRPTAKCSTGIRPGHLGLSQAPLWAVFAPEFPARLDEAIPEVYL